MTTDAILISLGGGLLLIVLLGSRSFPGGTG